MLATTTGVPLFAALVALIWVDPPRDRPTVPIARAAAATPLPAMALAHRPFLLFDGDEGLRTPLDVDRLLATEQVALCPGDEGSLPVCLTLRGASDLRNGVGNLRFDTGEIEADAEIDTTIYVNVARHATEPGVVYLDYWWYLIDNPADTARGAMCGAGLVIPDITCFDHQSDWEGVTVVAKDPGGEPVAVQYAAHDRIVRVPWGVLQTAWAKPKMRKHTVSRDVSAQPLVFIARGTHAAYPMPCTDEPCSTDTVSPEKRHDGTYAWPERPCGGDCVAPFPATGTGSPASWNAFDGRWGTAVCVLDDLCARAKAPVAPGRQARFKAPWCYSHVVVRDTGTLTPVKGAFKRCKRAAGV
jgi:hypothetical protein